MDRIYKNKNAFLHYKSRLGLMGCQTHWENSCEGTAKIRSNQDTIEDNGRMVKDWLEKGAIYW